MSTNLHDVNATENIEGVLEDGITLITRMARGVFDSDGDPIQSLGNNANTQYLAENFAFRDYCWCDFGDGWDEAPADPATSIHPTPDGHCPVNFEHYRSGLRITWYKHFGRSMSFENLPESADAALEIILDCLKPVIARTPSLPREVRQPAR